jgi:putative SOS response-associated peptidase YedK
VADALEVRRATVNGWESLTKPADRAAGCAVRSPAASRETAPALLRTTALMEEWRNIRSIRIHSQPAGAGTALSGARRAGEGDARAELERRPDRRRVAVLERSPRGEEDTDTVQRQLRPLRWGLVPSWAKDVKAGARMINARVETVHEKPAYRRAFARRRCLLPADGFYEWEQTEDPVTGKARKQPYFIHPEDEQVLALAGLYEYWRDPAVKQDDDPAAWLMTCTIITNRGHRRGRPCPPAHAARPHPRPLRCLARPRPPGS